MAIPAVLARCDENMPIGCEWCPARRVAAGLESKTMRLSKELLIAPVLREYAKLVGRTDNLQEPHIQHIAEEVWARWPCSFLIFGLGEDTRFWSLLNRGGRTLFIEDDPYWMRNVVGLEVKLVSYSTRRDIPSEPCVLQEAEGAWDLILIDGPAAYNESKPGRQQSILTASAVRGSETVIFVHDYEREHDRKWCDYYLGKPTTVLVDQNSLAVFENNNCLQAGD